MNSGPAIAMENSTGQEKMEGDYHMVPNEPCDKCHTHGEELEFNDRELWEMLEFSPPTETEMSLRCIALAKDEFFSELLLQLMDKLMATQVVAKDEFHHRVINKCLTQLDIMMTTWTENRNKFTKKRPKTRVHPKKKLE